MRKIPNKCKKIGRKINVPRDVLCLMCFQITTTYRTKERGGGEGANAAIEDESDDDDDEKSNIYPPEKKVEKIK